MQKPTRTAAPGETPVTLAEARDHLNMTSTSKDALISIYIEAATAHLDGWSGILGRCMVTQTWRLDLDCFPACDIRLPFPDVQSVTVAYTDEAGATQTLASSNYHLVQDERGSALMLADGAAWPGTDVIPNAVRVTMVCGYGAAAAVPAALKAAVLLHVGHLFANREAVGDGGLAALPLAHDALIAPYRRRAI
jgi:uncharacterized phiE125 gp8 family phage protein